VSDVPGLLLHRADEALVAAVADQLGASAEVARDPSDLASATHVVGIATRPWPGWGQEHDAARTALAVPYYAVESWHRHPTLIDALAAAIAHGREQLGADAHVLLTAPDAAGRRVAPEERTFLREAVEAVSRAGVSGATIAWDHAGGDEPTAPTVATVLTSLAEAHGRDRVVACGLEPGGAVDERADEVAAAVGIRLVQVRPGRADLVACLAEAFATVVEHEGLA
jgi:hypothetical protein